MLNLFIKLFLNPFYSLPRVLRYILVGGFNTLVGYLIFVLIFLATQKFLNKQIVLLISFALSASISFVNLKIFVFQTKGNWLKEYKRTLITYIIAYLINAACLMILTDILKIPVIPSQAIATVITAAASYFIHKIYSFSK